MSKTKTILQIPLDKDLKEQSEKEALRLGFSSLQELVRVFLTKFANGELEFAIIDKTIEGNNYKINAVKLP